MLKGYSQCNQNMEAAYVGRKFNYYYSTAFKQKVVSEVESGKLSIEQARRIYDIGGKCTIQKWVKKFGTNKIHQKRVRIEMPDEINKLKKLEQEKQQLEHALAQAHLKLLVTESLLECVEEHYHIDVKKTFGSKAQAKSFPKPKKRS